MTPICNVCGNRLINQFSKIVDPITNEIFAIHKCSRCGLGHTVPKPKNMNKYYGDVYYGNRHSFTSKFCVKRRLGFVKSAISISTKIKKNLTYRLLDIGCGDGTFLLNAKNNDWEVIGTELAPQLARSAGLNVMETIDEVVEKVSDNSLFDCITMWHSLEHISDIKTTLSQLSQILKPDGKLIVAVPNNGSIQSKFFKHLWLHLDVPRHLYHFDIDSLYFCLKDAGFALQNQWHQELEYDLIGWVQSALNSFFLVPNAFLDYLTGKKVNKDSTFLKISNFVLGSIFTALFLPVVVTEKLLGRSGTIIVVVGLSGNVDEWENV